MKKIKINAEGFSHILIPLIVVIMLGAIGTYTISRSHAATPTATDTTSDDDFGPDVIPNVSDSGVASIVNPDGSTVSPSATGPKGCVLASGWCYLWVGQKQKGSFTATGISADISQNGPKVATHDNHSLAEAIISSANGKQQLEIGWIVTKNHNKKPELFESHWVDGKFTCYDKCGFVKVGTGSSAGVGQEVSTGISPQYKIQYSNSKWIFYHNGVEIGYLPESIWGGNFKTVGQAQIYGEIGASTTQASATEMGNGKYAGTSGSAFFENYHLIGSNKDASLFSYRLPTVSAYTIANANNHEMNYGGPGF